MAKYLISVRGGMKSPVLVDANGHLIIGSPFALPSAADDLTADQENNLLELAATSKTIELERINYC